MSLVPIHGQGRAPALRKPRRERTRACWRGLGVCLGLLGSIVAWPESIQSQVTAGAAPISSPRGEGEGEGEAVGEGARVYALYCASCHGAGGSGDGALSRVLNPSPARLDDPVLLESRTDADLYRIIALGGEAVGRSAGMAAWEGTLTSEQISGLVAYLRALQRARVVASPAPD